MIQNILFIDIETVPQRQTDLTHGMQMAFEDRYENQIGPEKRFRTFDDAYDSQAALFAEFGKIICIGFGFVIGNPEMGFSLRIKTLCSRFEKILLEEASEIIGKFGILCAHNGKLFDFPYLFRRLLINGLSIPPSLKIAGRKSWDIPHIDTMEIWSHMEWKYRVSLNLLAQCLGLPSPKEEMEGSKVGEIYYSMFEGIKNDELPFDKETEVLNKIGSYCAGDIKALVNVYCKLHGLPIVADDKIVTITK